jgi:hypothetical protein
VRSRFRTPTRSRRGEASTRKLQSPQSQNHVGAEADDSSDRLELELALLAVRSLRPLLVPLSGIPLGLGVPSGQTWCLSPFALTWCQCTPNRSGPVLLPGGFCWIDL